MARAGLSRRITIGPSGSHLTASRCAETQAGCLQVSKQAAKHKSLLDYSDLGKAFSCLRNSRMRAEGAGSRTERVGQEVSSCLLTWRTCPKSGRLWTADLSWLTQGGRLFDTTLDSKSEEGTHNQITHGVRVWIFFNQKRIFMTISRPSDFLMIGFFCLFAVKQ